MAPRSGDGRWQGAALLTSRSSTAALNWGKLPIASLSHFNGKVKTAVRLLHILFQLFHGTFGESDILILWNNMTYEPLL